MVCKFNCIFFYCSQKHVFFVFNINKITFIPFLSSYSFKIHLFEIQGNIYECNHYRNLKLWANFSDKYAGKHGNENP